MRTKRKLSTHKRDKQIGESSYVILRNSSEPAIHPEDNATNQVIILKEREIHTARGPLTLGAPAPLSPLTWLPLAAFSPFHILLPQNTRHGRRTDVRFSVQRNLWEGRSEDVCKTSKRSSRAVCVFASKTLQWKGPSEGCVCGERQPLQECFRPANPTFYRMRGH